jgi:hypothetical protein
VKTILFQLISTVGGAKNMRPAILALCAVACFGQAVAPAEDPGGWTLAKWGMTQTEVSSAFPMAVMQIDPISKKPVLSLNGFPIQNLTFFVRFGFGKDGHLEDVVLEPEGDRATHGRPAKSVLLTGLTDKYGKPDETAPHRDGPSMIYEWKWLSAQTAITLSHVDYGLGNTALTFLKYHRRASSSAL